MSITKVLSGLQPWDKDEYNSIGLSDEYIDMVNDANQGYRDYVLSKLNLNSTVNLHGGGIKLEFSEINNKLPMDKIISLVEAYGEDYITNQLGGGFIDWIKSIFGKRDFDAFKARYDKLRDELDKKIVRFEVETRGMKADTEVNAKYMKALLLNKKMKTMMEIMIDNQTNMKPERKKYILNLISLATVKEQQILVSINEYNKIVAEKNEGLRPYLFGLLGKKQSFFDKLSADYEKTAKEFNEVFKHFSELMNQTLSMQSLKAKYGSLTPDIKAKLAKSQVKEFEHWEKNRSQYEKIEAFTEAHLEEANKLVQKQAELNMLIHDYNSAFGTLGKQRTSAEDTLKDWDSKIRSVYFKITQCVELGSKYFGILDGAMQLIVNNSNLITTLSISAMEPVIKEYETHITSVDYTSNLMKKLVGTLGEIKNNFIKLVPSQNLQADILYVGATRTYLLSLIENIRRRQINFSGGEKYLRDVIKGKIRGGAILNQDGGMYLKQSGFDTYPLYFLHANKLDIVKPPGSAYDPTIPGTFYKYNDKGPLVALNAIGAGKDIIDVPYGTILYDTLNPPKPGTTNIAVEYDKWIDITDNKDTMFLPIIDFDADVIKIYEIKYTDISDLSALDISATLLKDINITHRNKKEFISYKDSNGHEYFIYNIYADDVDELNIKGIGKVKYYEPLLMQKSNYAILPVFAKIRTSAEMIKYDEYHLLNPLTGLPILAIVKPDDKTKTMTFGFKTQSDVATMDTDNGNGNTMYYHFNAVGIKYNIADATILTMDYGAGAGPEPFKLRNEELAKQPNVIDYHWGVMYQLTMILNNIFNRCLSPKTTIDTTKVNFDISNTRNINSVIYQVGIGNIDDADHTKIKLEPMNLDTFATNFFGGDPRSAVIIIRKIINKELTATNGNLLFNPTAPGPNKKTTTGTILGVAAPKPDSLSPKQRQAFDYVIRSIPKSSPYWSNQGKILAMIEEFFKPEYKDKFELELHAIQNLIYDIRAIEQGILKININVTNKDELPKYSLITEEMEVKPNDLKLGETGDTITNAGKDLRALVQNRSEFAAKFAAELGVNESNIITLLEADNFLLNTFSSGGSKQTFADWVRNPAYPDRIKILDFLENVDLAKKFVDQLKAHPVYNNRTDVICERITADGGVDKYKAKGAYDFLRGLVKHAGKRDDKQKPQQPGQTEFAVRVGAPSPATKPGAKPRKPPRKPRPA